MPQQRAQGEAVYQLMLPFSRACRLANVAKAVVARRQRDAEATRSKVDAPIATLPESSAPTCARPERWPNSETVSAVLRLSRNSKLL